MIRVFIDEGMYTLTGTAKVDADVQYFRLAELLSFGRPPHFLMICYPRISVKNAIAVAPDAAVNQNALTI